jgi:hypothetical protein
MSSIHDMPFTMAAWLVEQKMAHSKGGLSTDKVQTLVSIGVDVHLVTDDYQWCAVAKQKHASGELSAEEVAACESIPGWNWEEQTDEEFKSMVVMVEAFVKENGRLPKWP